MIGYLDTRKIGTVRVFSMFFATAFCIPSMATTPSITPAGSLDAGLVEVAGAAEAATAGFAATTGA